MGRGGAGGAYAAATRASEGLASNARERRGVGARAVAGGAREEGGEVCERRGVGGVAHHLPIRGGRRSVLT